jgi:carbon-monoxide dehydrogenase large subunit
MSGDEITENTRPIWQDFPPPAKYKRLAQRWLATDVVRHAGEAVAAVIAERKEIAEDARDLVQVDYDPLGVVVDAEEAIQSKKTLLYPEWGNNVWVEWNFDEGDVLSTFSSAHAIVKRKFKACRATGAPMEPGGTIADYDALSGRLTLWMSKQDPHKQRLWISRALDLPLSRLRVISSDVGGGFGTKLNHYSEDIVVGYAALKLKRPIRWIMTRSEQFLTVHQSREMTVDVELAANRDGRILGVRGKLIGNVGVAHKGQWGHSGPLTCLAGALLFTGPYDIKNFKLDVLCAVTNTAPEGALRGFGIQETTYAREMLIDIVGKRLHIDPVEMRRRNLIREFPYKSVSGQMYESGDYDKLLDTVLKASDYYGWTRKKKRKTPETSRRFGVGISMYAKGTAAIAKYGEEIAAHELVTVEVLEDGRVMVKNGSADIGTQHMVTLAQVVAERLSVNIDDVAVQRGDTDASPLSLGPYSSRMGICAASAALIAADKIKQKILKIAACLLEARADDLELIGGEVKVRGSPGAGLTLAEIAHTAYVRVQDLPEGMEPTLSYTGCFTPPAIDYGGVNIYGAVSVGAMVAIVEVDAETGKVNLLRSFHVHDSGNVINPAIVHGQSVGALAQGIGGALYEEITYDENGQLLSGTFMDYLLPSALEISHIEDMEGVQTPARDNPLGVKGVGESPILAPPAALANAIADAFSESKSEFDLTVYPMTPERVFRAIKNASTSR